MSASLLRAVACAAAMLAGFTASPAAAFEGLERLIRLAPALNPAKPGALFSYARVRETVENGLVAVDTGGLALAYGLKDEFRKLFGIDNTALLDHAVVGEPPNQLSYVHLDRADVVAMRAALRKRGFERTMVGTHEVLASGEDYGADLRNLRPADPFGGALGASQRFLLRDDTFVVARGWPGIRTAVAALDGARPPTTALFAASIAAVRDAIGQGAVASQAVLYGLPTFVGATLDREAADAIAAGRLPRLPSTGGMPPFVAAWLIAGMHGKDAFATVAALYGDKESAERGTAEIARRVQAFGPWDGGTPTFEVKTAVVSAGWIGVVTARFGGQPLDRGALTLRRWQAGVMNRDFTPLDPLR